MKKVLLTFSAFLAVLFAAPSLAQTKAEIVGDWHGTMTTGTGDVTLVLRIEAGEDGAFDAEMESWTQAPGRQVPVTDLVVADGRLEFKVPAVGASYEGEWDNVAREWHGSFSQGAAIRLDLRRGAPPPHPRLEGLDGLWQGVVESNGVNLRQLLRVASGEWGTIAFYDSPDQMITGLPISGLSREGQVIRFSVLGGLTSFSGTLSDDNTQITGTWITPGQPDLPVTLTHAAGMASLQPPARPQMPGGPFPYRADEVFFENPAFADVKLAGTLTLPESEGPFPAAILITGSGAQDRDETTLGHKPFAVIADHLTRNGVAVLRFDDRGVGKSTGDYGTATSADLATDANAAFAYLRSRPEIRHDAIGFIGHSEGAMIAPIAMAANDDVAFFVSLAGPGMRHALWYPRPESARSDGC